MAPMRDELLLPPRLTSMAKQKKPGDSTTPSGSPEGPPGKKQRSKARKKHSKNR